MEAWQISLWQVGVFAVEALIILFAVLAVILVIAANAGRGGGSEAKIEIEHIHEKYRDLRRKVKAELLDKKDLKKELKAQKKEEKEKSKSPSDLGNVYVLDFDGDIKASAVDHLREEITAVLTMATSKDEVILKLESPGGVVHGYGLAAAQLLRLREKNVPLTVCVDKVAASGGYMMACTANKIYAAPFAILGSIGVVAQVPNFNKVLKKHDVEYKEYTAGDYKRTVSMFGEITEKGEQKFLTQLQETHDLFKSFVGNLRPQIDMAKVATGEYWFGEQAILLKLCDELKTSDAYITDLALTRKIYSVKHTKPVPLIEKLTGSVAASMEKAFLKIWTDLMQSRWQ